MALAGFHWPVAVLGALDVPVSVASVPVALVSLMALVSDDFLPS